jgi:hypothetical protein
VCSRRSRDMSVGREWLKLVMGRCDADKSGLEYLWLRDYSEGRNMYEINSSILRSTGFAEVFSSNVAAEGPKGVAIAEWVRERPEFHYRIGLSSANKACVEMNPGPVAAWKARGHNKRMHALNGNMAASSSTAAAKKVAELLVSGSAVSPVPSVKIEGYKGLSSPKDLPTSSLDTYRGSSGMEIVPAVLAARVQAVTASAPTVAESDLTSEVSVWSQRTLANTYTSATYGPTHTFAYPRTLVAVGAAGALTQPAGVADARPRVSVVLEGVTEVELAASEALSALKLIASIPSQQIKRNTRDDATGYFFEQLAQMRGMPLRGSYNLLAQYLKMTLFMQSLEAESRAVAMPWSSAVGIGDTNAWSTAQSRDVTCAINAQGFGLGEDMTRVGAPGPVNYNVLSQANEDGVFGALVRPGAGMLYFHVSIDSVPEDQKGNMRTFSADDLGTSSGITAQENLARLLFFETPYPFRNTQFQVPVRRAALGLAAPVLGLATYGLACESVQVPGRSVLHVVLPTKSTATSRVPRTQAEAEAMAWMRPQYGFGVVAAPINPIVPGALIPLCFAPVAAAPGAGLVAVPWADWVLTLIGNAAGGAAGVLQSREALNTWLASHAVRHNSTATLALAYEIGAVYGQVMKPLSSAAPGVFVNWLQTDVMARAWLTPTGQYCQANQVVQWTTPTVPHLRLPVHSMSLDNMISLGLARPPARVSVELTGANMYVRSNSAVMRTYVAMMYSLAAHATFTSTTLTVSMLNHCVRRVMPGAVPTAFQKIGEFLQRLFFMTESRSAPFGDTYGGYLSGLAGFRFASEEKWHLWHGLSAPTGEGPYNTVSGVDLAIPVASVLQGGAPVLGQPAAGGYVSVLASGTMCVLLPSWRLSQLCTVLPLEYCELFHASKLQFGLHIEGGLVKQAAGRTFPPLLYKDRQAGRITKVLTDKAFPARVPAEAYNMKMIAGMTRYSTLAGEMRCIADGAVPTAVPGTAVLAVGNVLSSSAYAILPTLGSADAVRLTLNTQGGCDFWYPTVSEYKEYVSMSVPDAQAANLISLMTGRGVYNVWEPLLFSESKSVETLRLSYDTDTEEEPTGFGGKIEVLNTSAGTAAAAVASAIPASLV